MLNSSHALGSQLAKSKKSEEFETRNGGKSSLRMPGSWPLAMKVNQENVENAVVVVFCCLGEALGLLSLEYTPRPTNSVILLQTCVTVGD